MLVVVGGEGRSARLARFDLEPRYLIPNNRVVVVGGGLLGQGSWAIVMHLPNIRLV